METARTPVIAVRPAGALAARPRLFAALAAAFPVAFRPWTGSPDGADAVLAIDDELVDGLPGFSARGAAGGARAAIDLSADDGVDRRLRGLPLGDRLGAPLAAEGATVLASAQRAPVWTLAGGRHRVASALPELGEEEPLYTLVVDRALTLVALVHFLRELTAGAGWATPPLRAAIVFDDPNLRWRSYGFIDFRRLVEHADEHDYHASMAMIPLDAGRPHRPTADLFRRRADRLSLVFHGNDHVKRELLGVTDAAAAMATAAQALARVERFERLASIDVDRVMMPPHGLCSEPMTRALGALGFDALCAIHALPWRETLPGRPLLAGWHPASFVGACPVIPRIPLGSEPTDIALRAFLDQPIVLYGHHDDVAGGLEPLAAAAARVNRMGDVRWCSLGEIARANVAVRVRGEDALVRPFSRRVTVALPEGVSTVRVEPPQDLLDDALVGWRAGGALLPLGADVPLRGGRTLDLRLHGAADVDRAAVPAPAWRPWPRLRRAATELRDRTLPLRPAARAG